MFHYILYYKHIITDLEFPQLIKLDDFEHCTLEQILIIQGTIPSYAIQEPTCYSHIDRKVSYISNSTCYLYIEEGKKITYQTKADFNPVYLKTYILGWGMSLLFYQRNALAIHCSCVANEQGAILISGESGSGKSTITTYLLDHGYHLMADDMVIVSFDEKKHPNALPAFPYQKLCRDVCDMRQLPLNDMTYMNEDNDKYLVPYQGSFTTEPVPVSKFIILTKASVEHVISEEITGMNKLHASMHSLFLKPLFGPHLYDPENGSQCLQLASQIPIYQIIRPAHGDSRNEVMWQINQILK